jgi:hypothetical protein
MTDIRPHCGKAIPTGKRYSVYLPGHLAVKLEGKSISSTIQQALTEYFEREKSKADSPT